MSGRLCCDVPVVERYIETHLSQVRHWRNVQYEIEVTSQPRPCKESKVSMLYDMRTTAGEPPSDGYVSDVWFSVAPHAAL